MRWTRNTSFGTGAPRFYAMFWNPEVKSMSISPTGSRPTVEEARLRVDKRLARKPGVKKNVMAGTPPASLKTSRLPEELPTARSR